jgi:hypothetical protein
MLKRAIGSLCSTLISYAIAAYILIGLLRANRAGGES